MNVCAYGCNSEGKHLLSSGKFCCSQHYTQCLAIRSKNATKQIGRISRVGCTIVQPTEACTHCGKLVSKGNYQKHVTACERGRKPLLHVCKVCDEGFDTYYATQRLCSISCKDEWTRLQRDKTSLRMKEGYADGTLKPYGGGLKRYLYQRLTGAVVKVQGTYELRVCKVLDQWVKDGIIPNWEYNADGLSYRDEVGKQRTYFPDFKVFTSASEFYYVEVKGFKRERDTFKWNAVINEHKARLEVWYKDDISVREADKD